MILVDTNVLSEPLRPRPDESVVRWLNAQPIDTLFISTVTVAELRFGVASIPTSRRRTALADRLDGDLFPLFIGRVLSFDLASAAEYGSRAATARTNGATIGFADGCIASIAAANGLTVASRDIGPFEAMGVRVIDPWDA